MYETPEVLRFIFLVDSCLQSDNGVSTSDTQTETIVHDMTCGCFLSLVQTMGRILHLGVRASHTQRPLPKPAALCRPQPGPAHQRAQQPALPRSTTYTARNLVSQPNLRAIPSPPSQTAAAAPAAAAVHCSRSQSQAVELRDVTSNRGWCCRRLQLLLLLLLQWQLQDLLLLFPLRL